MISIVYRKIKETIEETPEPDVSGHAGDAAEADA